MTCGRALQEFTKVEHISHVLIFLPVDVQDTCATTG